MGAFQIELHMREPEYDALSALIPGFGNTVEEVVQFIITDWLNRSLGIEWLQQHALVKCTLGKIFSRRP